MLVDITGLTKAVVLKALYDNSIPLGYGKYEYETGPISIKETELITSYVLEFDYLKGRIIKADIAGSSFDSFLYDRDLGEGAAQKVINGLRG